MGTGGRWGGEREAEGQRPLQAAQGECLVLLQTVRWGCAMGVCAGEPCARHDARPWQWEYGNQGIASVGAPRVLLVCLMPGVCVRRVRVSLGVRCTGAWTDISYNSSQVLWDSCP